MEGRAPSALSMGELNADSYSRDATGLGTGNSFSSVPVAHLYFGFGYKWEHKNDYSGHRVKEVYGL